MLVQSYPSSCSHSSDQMDSSCAHTIVDIHETELIKLSAFSDILIGPRLEL